MIYEHSSDPLARHAICRAHVARAHVLPGLWAWLRKLS